MCKETPRAYAAPRITQHNTTQHNNNIIRILPSTHLIKKTYFSRSIFFTSFMRDMENWHEEIVMLQWCTWNDKTNICFALNCTFKIHKNRSCSFWRYGLECKNTGGGFTGLNNGDPPQRVCAIQDKWQILSFATYTHSRREHCRCRRASVNLPTSVVLKGTKEH